MYTQQFELLIDNKQTKLLKHFAKHYPAKHARDNDIKITPVDLNFGDFAMLYQNVITCVGEVMTLKQYATTMKNMSHKFAKSHDICNRLGCIGLMIIETKVPFSNIKMSEKFNKIPYSELRLDLDKYLKKYFDQFIMSYDAAFTLDTLIKFTKESGAHLAAKYIVTGNNRDILINKERPFYELYDAYPKTKLDDK